MKNSSKNDLVSPNNTKQIVIYSALSIWAGQCLVNTPQVLAQGTMSDRALERSRFYTAPREYQIIDERPVIRDFREGPNTPGQIGLPNGPGGGAGAGGMGGLGGGNGINATVPSTGLPIPGGSGPGYRNDPTGMSTLPKSGFGGTNIPARGMAPKGILPVVNRNVVGNIMNQNQQVRPTAAAPAKGLSARGLPSGNKTGGGPSVANYGGYGNSPTSYGNGMRTERNVRGSLLNSK